MRVRVNVQVRTGVLLFLSSLFCVFFYSSISYASTPIILPSGNYDLSIAKNISVFEDAKGHLTAEDVAKREIQLQFSHIHTDYFKIGVTQSVIWLRLSLYNPFSEAQSTVLTFSNPHIDTIRVYKLTPESRPELANLAYSQNTHRQSQAYFIDITAQTVESYLFRIQTDAFLNTSIELKSPDQYLKNESRTNITLGIALGLTLASLIFFCFSLIQKFSIFTFLSILYCLALMLAMPSGLGVFNSYWNIDRNTSSSLDVVFYSFASMVYLLTALALKWKATLPKVVICLSISIQAIFIALSFSIDMGFLEASVRMAGLIANIILLAFLFLCASEHQHLHRSFIISNIALSLSICAVLLNAYNIISIDVFSIWVMIILPVISLLFFISINLLDRSPPEGKAIESTFPPSLLSAIAHELKTPSENIANIYELISDTPLSMTQRNYIEQISVTNQEVAMLTYRIENLVSVKTNTLSVESNSFLVDDLVNDVVMDFQPEANAKRVELLIDVSEISSHFLIGDFFKIRVILHDFIKQLLTHVDNGEIYICARYNQDENAGLVVQLQFSGGSINQKELNNALHCQLTGDPTNMDMHPEAWSGYVVCQLVKAMQGHALLEYHSNKSGCLDLFLPLPLSGQSVTKTEPHKIQELMDKKALIVAGNSALRSVLEKRLRLWNVVSDNTYNSKEALALLRNQSSLQAPYDLIIIDQDIPMMSEFQLMKRILEDEDIKFKPHSILITGLNAKAIDKIAMDAGFESIVAKPINSDHLLESILRLLAK